MSIARPAQVNVRSDIVKRRVQEVAARTGMSATRFLEEAVQLHEPPSRVERSGRLVRDGKFWVMPRKYLRAMTLEDINAAIDATRMRGDIED